MSLDTQLSTAGLQLQRGSRLWRSLVELLSSMRLAIALLVIVGIASMIGTVLQQGQDAGSYINQFGPFWADVFRHLQLDTVYSSWWFLAIMAVLLVSTSLCVVRNTPRIIHDLRSYKDHVREQTLRALHDHAEGQLPGSRAAEAQRLQRMLGQRGWKMRVRDSGDATLIAAKNGAFGRVGYILAHSAFVLICLGGLLDGDAMIRLQMLLSGKSTIGANMPIAEVPARNILSAHNPSYRGNVAIPEGGSSNMAVLNLSEGQVLQPLPFTIKLDKFIVDYYSTGMPKLFASRVEITDRSGHTTTGMVKVNEPLVIDGVSIFQSGFDDGGSHLQLRAWPMNGPSAQSFTLNGDVGSSRPLSNGRDHLSLELTGFRLMNVEALGQAQAQSALSQGLQRGLGAAVDTDKADKPTNVGPAVVYKLRDAAGQAHEYFNYMQPIQLNGTSVFVAGERSEVGGNYRYLRIPVDADGGIQGWMQLRAALHDPQLRRLAVQDYVGQALPVKAAPQLRAELESSVERTLDLFAGDIPRSATGAPLVGAPGGLPALGEFLDRHVPKAQQEKASQVFVRLLNGVLWQLWDVQRQHAGLAPVAQSADSQRYFDAAVMALSDSTYYPAPLLLQLTGFQQVQASVFQVARAPGKKVVYLGSILLVLGVFAMLFIRERRMWLLLRDGEGGACSLLLAMSTNRRTLDFDKEFSRLRDAALGAGSGEQSNV